MSGSGFGIIDSYTLMDGMRKYVMSGAVPGLRRVEFHAPDKGAYTEGDCIYLPSPAATGTEEDVLLWRYYAEHEMGHEDEVNSHPHWLDVMNAHRNKGEKYVDDLFWSIANCLSDHVQEHNRVGVMVGRDYVLGEGRRVFMQRTFASPEAKDGKMAGLGFLDWDARSEWNPFLSGHQLVRDVRKWPEGVEWSEKFKKEVNLSALKNEQDVFDAALKIRKLFTDEEAKAFQEQQGEGKGKSRGSPKEGSPGTNPCEMTEHTMPKAGKKGRPDEKGVPHAVRFDASGGIRDGVYHSRKPFSLKQAQEKGACSHGGTDYTAHIKAAVKKTNLPAKVRAHLLAQKAVKYVGGYRAGKLDTNRLTDVLRGRDDVFRRREEKRMVNTAVSLLVDASGSMSGKSYTDACASAVMMAEALQGIGVDVEIAGFTEWTGGKDGLVHEIVSPFGQRFVKDRVVEQLANLGRYLCQNADGENILYAYNRLRRQPQPKKILIVLSDGQPACYGNDDNEMDIHFFTEKVIKEVEADKNVEIWGIGMGYTPNMYKKRVALSSSTGLETALLSLVQKFIESPSS